MPRPLLGLLFATLLALPASAAPNIILILVDDLGYGDLGSFFQDARRASGETRAFDTPQLDAMAAQGMRLTHHYVPAPVCASSRASLIQGRHQGHSDLRDNRFDAPIGDNHTLATVLSHAGYYTACVGKWGVGGSSAPWPAHPLNRGFDEFFGYLKHREGHEHYPRNATTDKNAFVYEGFTPLDTNLLNPYTTDLWTARAKKIITDQTTSNPSRPFFLYLNYETPHFKLQVPNTAYPPGPGQTGGVQWTGPAGSPPYVNTATAPIDSYFYPETQGKGWPTNEQKHVSMIRRIGDAVHDLLQTLRDLGIDHDTLVVFTSDNGAHDEGGHSANYFDSFGPFGGIKRDLWEGGIRTPAIAWWPGTIAPGTTSATPSNFYDWLPTFADAAGLPTPAYSDGTSLLPSLTGDGSQPPRDYLYWEYFHNGSTPNFPEFHPSHRNRPRGQMQAIRIGDHKGLRTSVASATAPFLIYDVVNDPGETTNLGALPEFSTLQSRFQYLAQTARRPDPNSTRPYDTTPLPAVPPPATTPGLDVLTFQGDWPYLPELRTLTPLATTTATTPTTAALPAGDNTAALFTGYFDAPATGTYTFTLTTSGGGMLYLHDSHLIDDDFNHDGSPVTASANLAAGLHPFRLASRHTTGEPTLTLTYSGPGISTRPVPASALSRDTPPRPEPAANPDSATTFSAVPVTIDVLANDTDDGTPAPLTVASVRGHGGGTATTDGQTVTFTPSPGFLGTATLTYRVTDGRFTAESTATVRVHFDDPELWLPFNEFSGTTTTDASAYRTATLTGFSGLTSHWTPTPHGRGLTLDGIDDSATVDNYTPPSGTAPRTVAAWVRTNSDGAIASWGTRSSSNKWHFRIQSDNGAPNTLRVEVEGGYIVASTPLTDGAWHHVAAVFDPDIGTGVADIALYVDGTRETTSASSPQPVDTAPTPLTVGTDSQDRYFAGTIDELHLYPRALAPAEIANLAAAASQPAAAWHHRYFAGAPIDWSADDDRDGTDRLTEFALVSQPHLPDRRVASPVYAIDPASRRLRLTLTWRAPATHGLAYRFQTSPDLATWSPAPVANVLSTTPGPPAEPASQTVTLDLGPTSSPPSFHRVHATLSP